MLEFNLISYNLMKSHALFDCIRCVSRIHRLQEIEDLCGLHGTVTVYGCKTLALLRSDSFNFIVLKDTSMEVTTYSFRSCIRGYHVCKDIWDSVVGEVLDCEVRLV